MPCQVEVPQRIHMQLMKVGDLVRLGQVGKGRV